MNRIGILVSILALSGWPCLYAGADLPVSADPLPPVFIVQGPPSDAPREVPGRIRNNPYFIESERLAALAAEAFEYGDYDSSVSYAAEAQRFAQLSDEYVAVQVKIWETDHALRTARNRFEWAGSVGAAGRYPEEYGRAKTAYGEALDFKAAEEWDAALDAARRVLDALAAVTPPPALTEEAGETVLPTRYTVRPWALTRDCFWNIAGRPAIYGDSTQWRRLYEANRAKLPQPNNPDLIHPGMILDIPRDKR